MYDEALWWLDMGIAVVPQVYGTKIPAVKWKHYTLSVPPTKLVQSWFRGKRNLGIIPSDGLFVFDFDIPYEYVKWSQRNKNLADTMTVRTKRGWHVYLYVDNLIDDEIKSTVWPFGDIKVDMTVTVPPSVVSGWRYKYTKGKDIARVRSLDEADIELIERIEVTEFPTGEREVREVDTQCVIEFLSRFTALRSRSDGTMMGICPFHADQKPSLQVWPWEGRFYCHSNGCQAHRRCDLADAVSMMYDIPLREAAKLTMGTAY